MTHTSFGRLVFVEIIRDIATADKPTAFAACDEVTLYAIAYHCNDQRGELQKSATAASLVIAFAKVGQILVKTVRYSCIYFY